MCACVCDIALRKCYNVLYLVVKWIFDIASHRIASHRIVLLWVRWISVCIYGMPSSTVIVTSFHIVFFILLEIKHNIHKTQDKMCNKKNIIGWIKLENVIIAMFISIPLFLASLFELFKRFGFLSILFKSATIEIPSSIVMIIRMIFIQTKCSNTFHFILFNWNTLIWNTFSNLFFFYFD